MSDSVFLPNLHYFLAQTDGTYRFPNSAEGDLLKRAKVEVEALQRENAELRKQLADVKSVLFVVQAVLEPADHESAMLMLGDGTPYALVRAAIDAARKEAQP